MGVLWGRQPSYKKIPGELIKPGDGVNTFNSPFEIKKSEGVSALNTSSRQHPALSVRAGTTAMYGTVASPIGTVNGAGTRNGTIPIFQDGTTWKQWNGTAFANIATSYANAKATIMEFNTAASRFTLLMNGTEKKAWDGSSVTSLTDAPATRLITVDDFRIYALTGSFLYYSAGGSATDWTTVDDAGRKVLAGMIGTGTAVISYNGMKIAFSDQTMHIIYGSTPADLEAMDPIMAGCVSHDSMIVLGNILYFLDYGKYKAFTGGMPLDISQKVKGYLENINYTYMANICAGQWGKYIYLSIPYGEAQTTNNLTLEYDTDLKVWHVWNIGFSGFYNIGEDLFGVTTGGVVKKMQQGTADDATAITWEHVFGVWDATPVRNRKVLSDIWCVVDLPVGSTLNISYSETVDGGFTSLYDFTANANEQNTRVQVPVSALYDLSWYRLKVSGVGPCTIHYLEPYVRVKTR